VGGCFLSHLGEGILPLFHFLPRDLVFGLDLTVARLPNYAVGSGISLPFGAGTFDLVSSCDTLEHIPDKSRVAFTEELLRVASRCVVLVAPFDTQSTSKAERILQDYLTAQGLRSEQLQEHLDHGLPRTTTLRSLLEQRGLSSVEFADGYLPHWLAMMVIKHTPGLSSDLHYKLDHYYNQHFSPYDRREPAYRRAFVIVQPGYEDLLPAVAHVANSSPPRFVPDHSFALDLGQMVRQSQIDAQPRLAALEAENAQLQQLVHDYSQGRFIRFMRWLRERRRYLTSEQP
jgi:hypothetical protein